MLSAYIFKFLSHKASKYNPIVSKSFINFSGVIFKTAQPNDGFTECLLGFFPTFNLECILYIKEF